MFAAQPIEHHRAGQNRRCRIGDTFAHNVRCAAMRRLKHSPRVPDICRRCKAHTPDQSCCKVREDIPEHIFCHQHVKLPGATDQIESTGVNIQALCFDIRVGSGHLIEDFAEKGH